MTFDRHARETVLEALRWSPVVLVEGPRQAGKTFLVRELVGSTRPAAYVTLDDALQLAAALGDPQGFVFSLPDPVVLDEVQRAPETFRALKLEVDEDRRPGRFLLTGSANVLLLPRLSDSLAGRMRIVTLWPLAQGEIDGTRDRFVDAVFSEEPPERIEGGESRESLAARITRGGFPEAVTLPPGEPRDGWMRDYVTTLLERDVREITEVTDRVKLPRLLRLLAARSGGLLNVSELSRSTGIPRGTIDRYIALFVTTFAVRFVPAWAGNVGRRLVKSPKVLFSDSGLCAHLTGTSTTRLTEDPDSLGPLLETFVGGELLRQTTWSRERVELMHYRDGTGNEVDWVLEDPRGRLVGIEVKASASPSDRDARGLRRLAEAVGDRFHRGVILHTGRTSAPLSDRIWALPVEALWRQGATSDRG